MREAPKSIKESRNNKDKWVRNANINARKQFLDGGMLLCSFHVRKLRLFAHTYLIQFNVWVSKVYFFQVKNYFK